MAAQKFKLGNTPKNFKSNVEIVMIDGTVGEIEFSFIYRTRSQLAAMIDAEIAKNAAAAKEAEAKAGKKPAKDAPAEPAKTIVEMFAESAKGGAEHILKIADGWDLDVPFSEAALIQLDDENAGALAAIAGHYHRAVTESRAKN